VERLGQRPALDGLRGLAIAGVVFFHAFGQPIGGFLGVDLFFVLSGFLITTLLLEEHAAEGRILLRAFYRRRALRLLPALAPVVVAFLLLTIAHPSERIRILTAAAAAIFYVSNLMWAFGHPGGIQAAIGPLWSLAQEEQFYLLWPPLLILLLRRRARGIGWALLALALALTVNRIVLSFVGMPWHRVYFAPDTHSSGILAGCALAFAWRAGALRRWPEGGDALVLGLLLLLAAFIATGPAGNVLGIPLAELAAIGLITSVLAAPGSVLPRALAWAPLRGLGRISYGLYLWHVLVAQLFHNRHPLLALLVAVLVAVISYKAIEKPFLRRKRRPSTSSRRVNLEQVALDVST
jgi:peptidoglycan/LPS O-acetylase OafA/YrhL